MSILWRNAYTGKLNLLLYSSINAVNEASPNLDEAEYAWMHTWDHVHLNMSEQEKKYKTAPGTKYLFY